MRYLKVLILAVFLFLAMVFFFQNQGTLSQEIELNMNLFFIPAMKSIPLPFYFIVIAGFLVGSLLTLCILIWDRCSIGAKAVRQHWKINNLEKKIAALQEQIDRQAKVETTALAAVADDKKKISLEKTAPEKKDMDEKKPL